MNTKLYPCLWFDGKAQEAAEFYCSIFPNSKILEKTPFLTLYHLNGNRYMHMNGGPQYTFNEAISLYVNCDTQEEIDHYWNALTKDGTEVQCGWLKDKYGVSWQIIPGILGELMKDETKAPKVIEAFRNMKKFIIADLIQAAKG